MSFKDSIIWENSGVLENYDQYTTDPTKGIMLTQEEIFLTPPHAIKHRLFSPVIPPVAVGSLKWFPINEDIYFNKA